MSAEILRRAAALMRQRADAEKGLTSAWGPVRYLTGVPESASDDIKLAHEFHASWTPGLAYDVACLLDDAAWRFEGDQRAYDDELARGKYPMWMPHLNKAALAVAQTYIKGEQP